MAEAPDDITPDDKDWTWVLDSRCPECGFDAGAIDPAAVGLLIRDNASEWALILAPASDRLRMRPSPDRWSALEYAVHVRDVYVLYLERLDLMLTEDGPRYPDWDQDQTAIAERYNTQDPSEVNVELARAAEALAARFDGVTGDQWTRTGYRSDGASFTVDSFSRYLAHDPVHHIWDVTGSRSAQDR